MKYYLLRVLLCLFFLSSPLLANDEEPLNPIQDLETEILSTKIPQGYEKGYAYRLNGDYVTRYDKSLPGGKDPYDAYIITIDLETATLKNLERLYTKHPKLEEKKLISKKKALQLSTALFDDYDGITLTLVDTKKITPYEAKPSQKTGLRYAYLVNDNHLGKNKVLYIDAYDGEILGLDQYNTVSSDDIPQEPESFFLNLWESIKRFFGRA